MKYKDNIVYYILNEKVICEGYYYGGFLSCFFAKRHYKLLCKKYPHNYFVLKKAWLSDLIEEAEGRFNK